MDCPTEFDYRLNCGYVAIYIWSPFRILFLVNHLHSLFRYDLNMKNDLKIHSFVLFPLDHFLVGWRHQIPQKFSINPFPILFYHITSSINPYSIMVFHHRSNSKVEDAGTDQPIQYFACNKFYAQPWNYSIHIHHYHISPYFLFLMFQCHVWNLSSF